MVDSWKLATISMWLDKLDNHEVLKLIGDTFTWEELWEAAVDLNQLCAARQMPNKIPKNKDQGDLKDRVAVLGKAMLTSLDVLKARADHPVFCATSSNLSNVPGVIKDRVQAEPAVSARLDNIEKMVENLSKGFNEMRAAKPIEWPAIQVNGGPAPAQAGQVQGGHLGAVPRRNLGAAAAATNRVRSVSPSVKRSAEAAELEGRDETVQQPKETPWSTVAGRKQGRRQKPVQYGTAKVNIAGGEARPFDVVIGNTNLRSTENIIEEVLKNVSQGISEEMKLDAHLEILEVECLTKPREDGRKIWTKTFRVQVPNKFKEHMMRPEAYPAGWTTRKYFPPRAPRPTVPELHPSAASAQPPVKKPNLAEEPHSLNQ